jgi:hypothetical protein
MTLKGELIRALWDADYKENEVSCPEIGFQIDQGLYAKLLAQAKQAGVTFDGESAAISGVQFLWNYDAPSGTLHVTCTKKPWIISCDQVAAKIADLIEKAKKEAL